MGMLSVHLTNEGLKVQKEMKLEFVKVKMLIEKNLKPLFD